MDYKLAIGSISTDHSDFLPTLELRFRAWEISSGRIFKILPTHSLNCDAMELDEVTRKQLRSDVQTSNNTSDLGLPASSCASTNTGRGSR